MSGVIAWLTGFLDGSVGKYTFRATTFRSDTFASGCWTGVTQPAIVEPIHRPLRGPDGIFGTLLGIVRGDPLRGPDGRRGTLRGGP